MLTIRTALKTVDITDSDVLCMTGDDPKTLLSQIAMAIEQEAVRVSKQMPFS